MHSPFKKMLYVAYIKTKIRIKVSHIDILFWRVFINHVFINKSCYHQNIQTYLSKTSY